MRVQTTPTLLCTVLLSPKSHCLEHDRPINPIVGARNRDSIQKASQLRRWWTCVQEPLCLGLDASLFYRTEEGKEVKLKKKCDKLL